MILRHKYGAKRCVYDEKKFPSKLERDCYIRLKDQQAKGNILFFLRHVPFDLPGNTKYIVDFEVFLPTHVIFIEAKGKDLALGKMKRLQTEELYKIPVYVASQASQVDSIISGMNIQ